MTQQGVRSGIVYIEIATEGGREDPWARSRGKDIPCGVFIIILPFLRELGYSISPSMLVYSS